MIYARAFVTWLSFGVVAVTLGALRERLLRGRLGELHAHQVETIVASAVIFGIIMAFVRWTRPSGAEAIAVGAAWVVLTIAFEIGVFHFLMGKPIDRLLADFNVFRGRLWPLVLVTELAGPWVALKLVG